MTCRGLFRPKGGRDTGWGEEEHWGLQIGQTGGKFKRVVTYAVYVLSIHLLCNFSVTFLKYDSVFLSNLRAL